MFTLQGTNISHFGKRNIIFKMPFFGEYVSSLEGNLPFFLLGNLTLGEVIDRSL